MPRECLNGHLLRDGMALRAAILRLCFCAQACTASAGSHEGHPQPVHLAPDVENGAVGSSHGTAPTHKQTRRARRLPGALRRAFHIASGADPHGAKPPSV